MSKKLLLFFLSYSFYFSQALSMESKNIGFEYVYNLVCPIESCKEPIYSNRKIDWAKKIVMHLRSKHKNNSQYSYKSHNDFLNDLTEGFDRHLYFDNQKVTISPKNIAAKCLACGLKMRNLYRSDLEAIRLLNIHYSRSHKNLERSSEYFLRNKERCLAVVDLVDSDFPKINPELDLDDLDLTEIPDLFDYEELIESIQTDQIDTIKLEDEDFEIKSVSLSKSRNYKLICPDCNHKIETFRLATFISAVLLHISKHGKNNFLKKYKTYTDLKRSLIEQGNYLYMAGLLISDAPKNIMPKCSDPKCSYKPGLFRNEKEAFFALKMHYDKYHQAINLEELFQENKDQFIDFVNIENNFLKRSLQLDLFPESVKRQKTDNN